VCVCIPHLLYPSSVIGYFGCFYILAIVNSAAMSIGVHISSWIKILRRGLKPPLDPPPPPELKELKLACRVSSGNLN